MNARLGKIALVPPFCAILGAAFVVPAPAQNEQFIPQMVYRTGAYAPNGIPLAVAVGYPREKMYGVWWSGAEQDVRPAEDGAKGYNSVALQHTSGQFKLHEDLKKYLFDKGKGFA